MLKVPYPATGTAMHLQKTLRKHWLACLPALIVLAILPFAMASTGASAAKPTPAKALSAPLAARSYPAAPAGPRGPITISCLPGRSGVVGSGGPAGPQGPVGVSCPSAPQG